MTTTDNDSAKSVIAETGKNLLIEVPDWDSITPGTQTSYLRLGKFAVADMSEDTRGADLVAAVREVGPSDGWGATDAPGPRVFEDDWRTRPTEPADEVHQDSVAERQRKASALVSKTTPTAGWRDHTEGDRISTTRGDKLEVIGGNYKLVVLGRNPDAGQAAGFDLSGGLIQDFDAAPGTVNEIRWVQDEGGTWKVFEKCEKGIVHSLFHGDVTEEYYGKKLTTIVGSASNAQSLTADVRAMMDTTLVENPTIVEKTWAKEITSETTTPKMTETSKIDSLTTSLTATNVKETVNVSSDWDVRTTSGGKWVDYAEAERVYRTLFGDVVIDTLLAKGAVIEVIGAPFHGAVDMAAVSLAIATGARFDIAVGASVQVSIGKSKEFKLVPTASFQTDSDEIVLFKSSSAATSTSTAATSTTTAASVSVAAASVSLGPGAPTPPAPAPLLTVPTVP